VTLPSVAAEHLSLYAEAGPDGLVFPAERGGPIRRSNFTPPGLDPNHPSRRGGGAALP
jgi:hypothetical protein